MILSSKKDENVPLFWIRIRIRMYLDLLDRHPDMYQNITDPQHCLESELQSRNADLLISGHKFSPFIVLTSNFFVLSDVRPKCTSRLAICANNLHHRRGEKEHQGFHHNGNLTYFYSLSTVFLVV
jgi:hypothetical protein